MKNKWGYQRRKISSDMFILQINYLGENLLYVQAFLSLLKGWNVYSVCSLERCALKWWSVSVCSAAVSQSVDSNNTQRLSNDRSVLKEGITTQDGGYSSSTEDFTNSICHWRKEQVKWVMSSAQKNPDGFNNQENARVEKHWNENHNLRSTWCHAL